MQLITITGNLARDAELKATQSGDEVLSFSVASKQGWGDRATTNWFRVSLWGKRARSIADYLRKGVKVTVAGELSIGEYQGKAQFDIRASEVEFMSRRDDGGDAHEPSNPVRQDLDDEVPF